MKKLEKLNRISILNKKEMKDVKGGIEFRLIEEKGPAYMDICLENYKLSHSCNYLQNCKTTKGESGKCRIHPISNDCRCAKIYA